VAGCPARDKIELFQKDPLGGVGLLQGKGVQKVDQHPGIFGSGAGAKGIDQFADGIEFEVHEGGRRQENVGGSQSCLGGRKGIAGSVVEIADDGIVVEADSFSVGHGLGRNVYRRYVAIGVSEFLAGLVNGHAGGIVLPVVPDLVVGHAVQDRHGGVAKTRAQIDELDNFTVVLFRHQGANVFLEHGLVEVVRDVIEGVENADLVGHRILADVDVVKVLFLFVRLDSRIVDVVGGHDCVVVVVVVDSW